VGGAGPRRTVQQRAASFLSGAASSSDGDPDLAGAVVDPVREQFSLDIPKGTRFEAPEHFVHRWDVPLNADELIGLMGTLSWVILAPEDRKTRLLDEARRLLRDVLGIEGDVTVDVSHRADAWRTRRAD
jgi:hypothetical protein